MHNDYCLFTHDDTSTPRTIRLSQLLRYADSTGRDDVAGWLRTLQQTGARYSHHESDVLGQAWAALGYPKLWLPEVTPALGDGYGWEDTRARCS